MSKLSAFLVGLFIALSCIPKNKVDNSTQQTDREIAAIDSLLHSEEFALAIAESQSKAYYVGINEIPPPFLKPGEDTAHVEIKTEDEKIAINLAGFYALECGLGAVCTQTSQKPTDFLQAILANRIDAPTILMLNRFANATWKAGQPFRSLNRIHQPTFTVASLLPDEEIQKYYGQIWAASGKLLTCMTSVRSGSLADQMKTLRSLLQDETFAVDMAAYLDAGSYDARKKTEPPFLSSADGTTMLTKSVKEQKIATNIAGFYALEGGLDYLVITRHKRPSDLLKSIIDDTISEQDKQLLCRFANATWKAGQPFRGLNRINRATFTPFYFLTQADIEKDWTQIKAAAGMILKNIQ